MATTEPLEGHFAVRQAGSPREFEALLALRYEVFCVEQGVPEHEERDGRDRAGLHLIAVRDELLLGTCRLVFVGSTVQLSRLAVAAAWRRQGIATALLQAAEHEARKRRASRIVLHAQTYARPLYEQAGYRARGRVFVEAEIEHVAMEKRL